MDQALPTCLATVTAETPLQVSTKTTTYPRSKDPGKTGYIASSSVVVILQNPAVKAGATSRS